MPLAYPRPFLLARAFQPLNAGGGRTPIELKVPASVGGWLRQFTAVYQTTVEDGAQVSPDLSYRLYLDGLEITDDQTELRTVTTPAGGLVLRGIMPVMRWVPALSVLRFVAFGQSAAPLPATLSITYLLHKTWEAY